MSIIVGITGSIASGKTTLLKHMKEKGYKVFICDDYVKELYQKSDVLKQIKDIFPETDISNRKAIAKIIYSDTEKKKKLEKIIHPLVRKAMDEFVVKYKEDTLLFLEVPLLFESGLEKNCDYTITLLCPFAIREERAKERGIDLEIFKAIDKIQMPELEKKQRASYSIDTSGNLDDVVEEFDRIIGNLR